MQEGTFFSFLELEADFVGHLFGWESEIAAVLPNIH